MTHGLVRVDGCYVETADVRTLAARRKHRACNFRRYQGSEVRGKERGVPGSLCSLQAGARAAVAIVGLGVMSSSDVGMRAKTGLRKSRSTRSRKIQCRACYDMEACSPDKDDSAQGYKVDFVDAWSCF